MLALLSLLAPITIVGVLNESGALSCQNGEERWVGSWHDVGWSPVYGVPKSSGAEGTLVVVTGTPTTAPAVTAPDDLSCPPLQMRGDWIRTRSGIRYDRADKAPRHTLKVTDMRPFKGLSAAYSPTTDRITIQLTNPFDQPLTDVAVVLHYEGCYGKPNGFSRRHALGTLAPGATRPVDADARIMQPGPRGAEHTLFSVQVVGKGGAVLDIDAPPKSLGAEVTCRSRGKTRR